MPSSVFTDFVESARVVCGAIERLRLDNTRPLLSALIRLLYCADSLARCSMRLSDENLSEEVALPKALDFVPDDLVFHVVFDPLDQESMCASSLRDSLGDIYHALKGGLNVLERGGKSEDVVLSQWKMEYEVHWGRHLLDVITFLFLCPGDAGTVAPE